MRKTLRRRVADHLRALGFEVDEEKMRSIKGPKVKSDILECWHVMAHDKDGEIVEIASMHTMTELAKGLVLEEGRHDSMIYGDWLAGPPPKNN